MLARLQPGFWMGEIICCGLCLAIFNFTGSLLVGFFGSLLVALPLMRAAAHFDMWLLERENRRGRTRR